ncbi:hypothetical protein TWF696_008251 [Orbilia brochopaga]|uniref:Uncharacterized protein n=1 Tax=Orbilia brochopaga TaxID=3140254 RepID=A0AAV9UF92_9PEZI
MGEQPDRRCWKKTVGSSENAELDPYVSVPQALCCRASDLNINYLKLPVPVDHLFPDPGPPSDQQNYDLKIDAPVGANDQDPNNHPFGFFILSGPREQVSNLDKRDGSHWELYDCPKDPVEARHTVKAVCTNDGPDSNCGDIFLGDHGAPGTVVEMPAGCGPGRYAMAVKMEKTSWDKVPIHLVKRGLQGAPVYDFTFDYDFTPVQKRQDSKVLMRLDFSDDPGYWSTIVEPAGEAKKMKRDQEVREKHGGNHKRWLEHTWREEHLSTPHHELDELHKRWFSADVGKWIDRQSRVDSTFNIASHHVSNNLRWWLFRDRRTCQIGDVETEMKFNMYADLDMQVTASVVLTLIGNLGDLRSFDESHIRFRCAGDITATFHVDAFGRVSFNTGQYELFSLANFGATFNVPGIVTVGPNFRLLGQLSGQATLHAEAEVKMSLAKWDYTQQYPGRGDGPPKQAAMPKGDEPQNPGIGKDVNLKWDVGADGQIVAHITPKVTVGIEFKLDALASATVELGLDNYVRVYGSAGVGSAQDGYYCYGVDGGAELYAQINAPTMFGYDFSNTYSLWDKTFDIYPQKCNGAAPSKRDIDTNEVMGIDNTSYPFA